MRSMFVAVVGLLATGISARSAEVVESVGPTPPKAIAVRPDWSKLPQGVRITPRLETTEPLDGATRKEIMYGPYTVKAGKTLSKYEMFAENPCEDCFVTAIQYTSRYENKSEILTTDGIWMHHCVLSSTSYRKSYGPLGPGILWAGGNERPTLRLNTQYKYGIDWPSRFQFLAEYMSALPEDLDIYLAITFEYIEKEKAEAAQYKESYMIWNAVPTPKYENGTYTHNSADLVVAKSGILLQGMGHMHDGGTKVELYVNDKLACDSKMYYNSRPGYGAGLMPREHINAVDSESDGPAHAHDPFGMQHISDPGACTNFGYVNKGDKMHVKAYYNTKEYDVMKHQGKTEEQMGIMRVYIGAD